MELLKIESKDKLNDFVKSKKHSRFLQSWQWGEYQKDSGGKILRIGVKDKSYLRATATLIKIKNPIGDYFYSPHGPLFFDPEQADSEQKKVFFNGIGKIAKEEKVIFMRFEPEQEIQISLQQTQSEQIKKVIDVQPSKTTILDLNKIEEELLKNMHQKTRYNIRLAEKKGVKIREVKDRIEEFDKFWELMEKTVERDGFKLHPKKHYQKMFKMNRKYVKLFFGEYEGKVICAGIFSFFGDSVTYVHGASSNEHRNVMAPYLLHWHIIKLVKLWGFKFYDLFGIDEKKWPGVTRFKKGFGGYEKQYPGTFDLVFDKNKYFIYKMFRKLRRLF